MFVIVVTGGIGAGKSEAVRYLGSRGAVVLDLDSMAKELLEPGTDVYEAVVTAFGRDILGDDGSIVRSRLACEAFRSDTRATTLSAIMHPPVVEEVERVLEDMALRADPPRVVVMEVPLLVENPELQVVADVVVDIEVPEDVRLARLTARGMDPADARARMARQAGEGERRGIADVVIENADDATGLREHLVEFWTEWVAPRLPADKY